MTPAKKIFGTDGVRGVANVEPVTAETALKLGRAPSVSPSCREMGYSWPSELQAESSGHNLFVTRGPPDC